MIKASILEEGFTIVNIYSPNIEAPKYIKQILTYRKGEISGTTLILTHNSYQWTHLPQRESTGQQRF